MSCVSGTAAPMFRAARQLSESGNPLASAVGSRTLYLITAPIMLLSGVADMSIGLVAGLGSFCTLGMQRDIFQYTKYELRVAGRCISGSYQCFLRTLSPAAEFPVADVQLFSSRFLDIGKDLAKDCRNSDVVITKHLLSRLFYSTTIIGIIFTRTIELAIAVVAVPLSLLCLGQWSMMNAVAFNSLKTPCIIHDIFYLTMKTINPWAGSQ